MTNHYRFYRTGNGPESDEREAPWGRNLKWFITYK